jgi:serine/threonine-protein kinase
VEPTGVLLAQEIGRTRVYVRLALALAAFVLVITPLLEGDPLAKRIMVASMIAIGGVCGWLGWHLRTDAGYTVARTLLAGHLSMFLSFGAIQFFGLFSAAPMILPFGLFFFSSAQSVRATFGLYATCAGTYALLAGLVATGVLSDRGLLSGAALSPTNRVISIVAVEAVLLATYVAARGTRAAALLAIQEHDRAMRKLAARDALLREARADLDRALRAGGMGRFSDTTLGSYRLGRVLGRGGMGEVYEAVHATTRETAAVKLLLANVLADAEVVRRFMREAKIAASLDSPHVVKVLEVGGLDASFPYIAMELLRGEDLAGILRRDRQLSPRRTVALVREVGRGLEAARRAGIVHRDLKPQNVFLAEDGRGRHVWKILDFGVSKLVDAEATTTGELVGTPAYMAPEQIGGGGAVTHRTDLHALGAIAYRALTGRPAFTGESLPETLHQVLNEMPPAPSSLARLHPAFDIVLLVALAKEPADRFDSGEELAKALEAAVSGELDAPLWQRASKLALSKPWGRTA